MYKAHWNFNVKPFENTCDEEFYYPSEVHQGALLKLRYIIENRRAAGVLVGAAGLGKSLLIQRLLRQLPEEFAPKVHVVYPFMPHDQLLAYLAHQLTAVSSNGTTLSIEQSVRIIQDRLLENANSGQHVVLAIDESHLLQDFSSLEALRLLLNFESGSSPGLTLLFVGQPGLLPILDRMPGLEEQIGVKCLMRPFSEEETVSYVSHRIVAAGCEQTIFETDAFATIHQLAGGIPRRINRICDLALLIAYAEEQQTINSAQIEAVSDELVAVRPE